MKTEKHHLYVFGFGLSLILPYLTITHSLRLVPGVMTVGGVLAGFGLLLWAITVIAKRPVRSNLWVGLVFIPLTVVGILNTFGLLAWLISFIAVLFFLVTVTDVNRLIPVYHVWMKAARGIGLVVTTLLMVILFYGVFGVTGLVLRLLKKDLLARRFDPDRESYWETRTEIPERESYQKQY